MSSPLLRAICSTPPIISVCTACTVVTTPTVGCAIEHNNSMWPTPRAPISTTTASTSSGALHKVRGTPNSLLNDRSEAAVRNEPDRTAARRSLVVVLPTEPVIPTTRRAAGPGMACQRGQCRCHVGHDERWSATDPSTWTGWSTSTAAAPAVERRRDEVVSVTLSTDRCEQLPGDDAPGIVGQSIDDDRHLRRPLLQ